MKLLSLFSGIGAFEEGMKEASFDYSLVGFSEIDNGYGKTVSEVYRELHGKDSKNLGEIQNINGYELGNIDIITHGSPCQSFSRAGLEEGGKKGSGTESSLMWETVRLIKETDPSIVVWENVKSVYFKNHIDVFNEYLDTLSELGYENHHDVYISSDFGVPQKRERVFVVSLKNGYEYNRPTATNTETILRGILENNVDEKYNVPRTMIENWYKKKPPFGNRFNLLTREDEAYTLVAKGGRAVITNNYILANEESYSKITEYSKKESIGQIIDTGVELRALTPREYWRLQGWEDDRINVAFSLGVSDARLYTMAGNSITVPVVKEIFKNIYK